MLSSNFWKLWSAASLSSIGDGVRYTAIPLLAATYTRDPLILSLITLAGTLPWLLFSLPFGAIADRYPRRTLMIVSHLVRAGVSAALVAFIALGYRNIIVLAVSMLALATFEVLFESAAQAALPTVVSEEQLDRANSRMATSQMLLDEFAGPPLGAVLFAIAAVVPFVVDGVSFVLAAALLAAIPLSLGAPRAEGPRTGLGADIAEGIRWLRQARLVQVVLVIAVGMTLVRAATLAILVLFALEVLNTGPAGFGVLAMTMAVGSFVATLIAPRAIRRFGSRTVLMSAPLAVGALYVAAGIIIEPVFTGAMFALIGLLAMVWNVAAVSIRMRVTPNHMLGRVTSVSRLFTWGAAPFGALLGGLTGKWLGLSTPFVIGGALLIAIALVVLLTPSVRRALDEPQSSAPAETLEST